MKSIAVCRIHFKDEGQDITLIPKVPEYAMTHEDELTKRICVCMSLYGHIIIRTVSQIG